MLGTAENLEAKDNIGIIAYMENEIIKLASAKGFKGIFTTNTNALTQQFGETVNGYETLQEIVANQYVDQSGKKPFATAPALYKAIIMYKPLEKAIRSKSTTSIKSLRK